MPVGIGLNLFGVGEQTFELGSHGELMVVCADSFGHILCAERLGQTWFVDSVDAPGDYGMACLALDSSGAPALVYGTIGARNAYLFRVARRESVWVRDTIDFFESAYPNVFFGCWRALHDRFNRLHVAYVFSYDTGADASQYPTWQTFLYNAWEDSGGWHRPCVGGGYYEYVGAVSIAADSAGSASYCYSISSMIPPPTPSFWCDGERIDSSVGDAAIIFDATNRLHLAYSSCSGLAYRYRTDSVWSVPLAPGVDSIDYVDIVLDALQEPLIAHTTSDGVYLAHGVRVVGQHEEERRQKVHGSRRTATVARGVLFLSERPSTAGTALFDMTGRRVADLCPGANDVSALAPGVYFVREAQAQAVRKVIVAR